MSGKDRVGEGKEKAKETKDDLAKSLADDGVVNPGGLLFVGAGALFVAAIPVTSFIAQPNGMLEKTVNGLCSTVAFLGTAGSSTTIGNTSKIAALGALYCTVTYAFGGAISAASKAAGNKGGRDNNHPRAQTANLRGLPLRLSSLAEHLMENFPAWGFVAALAQAMAPGDQSLITLLGLHVIAKCFVFPAAYIANAGNPRSAAHIIATASVLNVAFRLAKLAVV